MKPIRSFLIGIFIAGSLATSLHFLHAQTTLVQSGAVAQDVNSMSDTEVLLQAIESVPPAPATSAPRAGTFFSAQHAPGTRLAWPPLPGNNGLPVWNLGDGVYLLDDLQVDYSLPVSVRLAGSGMGTMDNSGGPFPGYGGGGSTNGYEYSFTRPVYTTNDLWLEITGKTNTTAYLTIHEPWNVTNGVYDLFYTTNLSPPQNWSWVLRSFAGLTNLTVNNAVDPQGFYKLGPLTDPIGNDSLGTNFWAGFVFVYNYTSYGRLPYTLSLFVSSPAGASGTVSIPGLEITNAFTVAAGAVTQISITNDAIISFHGEFQETLENRGIHVTASQPVSVYGLFYEQLGSEAFTCYPTQLLGTNYCVMARPSSMDLGEYGEDNVGQSEFAIVATEDNTTVWITPSPTAHLQGSLWTNPITNLMQGQIYEASCIFGWTNTPFYDVTGTWITNRTNPLPCSRAQALLTCPINKL
jgi:hypothetical protein